MSPDPEPLTRQGWLTKAAHDASVSWSVGTFGALAEFSVDGDEAVDIRQHGNQTAITTGRGALRYRIPDDARLIAYEGLSKMPAYWSHGLSLCLPVVDAAMGGRGVLTELGPDSDPVRTGDRNAVLVDLGIGSPHIDACVRIADPALLTAIRPYMGKRLFTDGHPAAERLFEASPHRVFRSAAARIEVFGPISGANNATPDGPHTHLLPELLAHKRPIAANVPIPEGWLPVLNAYPPNPARDSFGDPRGFDPEAFTQWEALMDAFGLADLLAIKRRVLDHVQAGEIPGDNIPEAALAEDRFERTAARVALRQQAMIAGDNATLASWRTKLEPRT